MNDNPPKRLRKKLPRLCGSDDLPISPELVSSSIFRKSCYVWPINWTTWSQKRIKEDLEIWITQEMMLKMLQGQLSSCKICWCPQTFGAVNIGFVRLPRPSSHFLQSWSVLQIPDIMLPDLCVLRSHLIHFHKKKGLGRTLNIRLHKWWWWWCRDGFLHAKSVYVYKMSCT